MTPKTTVPGFALSDRARRTHQQPISYLMAEAVNNPELISLAAGLVDYATLPSGDVVEIAREILGSELPASKIPLQYGTTHGLNELRELLFEHICELDGVSSGDLGATSNDLVITTGSQQLLFILTDILVDPSDIVIAAWPSYFVYTGSLETFGADVRCVDMDDEGIVPAALEELLEGLDRQGQLGRVKIVYVVDYHQNPTGITLSESRRPQILDIVQRYSREHRILLLEDAAYRELTYEGAPPASIKSLERDNRQVALVQTFSKTFSPGLKTGYGLLPTDLVGPVLLQKGSHDFGSANIGQHLIHAAMRSGVYSRHVEKLRSRYTQKRDLLLAALEESLGPHRDQGVHWTHPRGGLYVWLTLPESVDTGFTSQLYRAAKQEGMIYVPGACCFAGDASRTIPRNTIRLSFGSVSEDEIRLGVERLGNAFRRVTEE